MYGLRPALRASPARPPARLIRRRRYPLNLRLRSFHTTRPLRQAPNPPQTPDRTPVSPNGANKADRDQAAAEDAPEAALPAEDPELLAQKLQRSRETSRRYSAALRRQQRGKKAQGLPPLHIPDWFLDQKVRRQQDSGHDRTHLKPRNEFSITVTHTESGQHATCSVPVERKVDSTLTLSRLLRGLWNSGLREDELHKVEKYFGETAQRVEKAHSGGAGELSKKEAADPSPPSPSADSKISETAETGYKMDKLLSYSKEQYPKKAEPLARQSDRLASLVVKREARPLKPSKPLSCLVSAEIKSTIAASLAALSPNSFPSMKTNLVLHSPLLEHERAIHNCIQMTALELGADVITIDAQDLARLAGDYLGEAQEPSPRSIRSLGYETYRLSARTPRWTTFEPLEEASEEEADFNQPASSDRPNPPVKVFILPPALKAWMQNLQNAQVVSGNQLDASTSTLNEEPDRTQTQSEIQLEDMKLTALLEALIDANDAKRRRSIVGNNTSNSRPRPSPSREPSKTPAFFDYSLTAEGTEVGLQTPLPLNARPSFSMVLKASSGPRTPSIREGAKILLVPDFKELNATHHGGRIIQKLEEIVRKRREAGESVIIIGTTCSHDLTPELSPSGVHDLQMDNESSAFRTIVIAPETRRREVSFEEVQATVEAELASLECSPAEQQKFRRINLLHIQEMLRSLHHSVVLHMADSDYGSHRFNAWAPMFYDSSLSKVLTYDEVHRIALTALGLFIRDPLSEAEVPEGSDPQMNWAHVGLAIGLLKASDAAKFAYFAKEAESQDKPQNYSGSRETRVKVESKSGTRLEEKSLQRQRKVEQIVANLTKHEKRLAPGIVNADQIKTTFDQVHVPKETKDSIRTITSLSLLRPEAFSYGILATEKISGALLYGPPGTGKTLLAKAVAKESGSTVLEVSGSQIMDKYVGEGEKNVAALFSLARKLSPCIVFLDEADAVFASRDAMRERLSHRDILNQFLKEWDGLNDLSVFVMVATNRPFDLDDAVIRRLPRRLLVDLPAQADREEILKIHLRGEQLDPAIDLADLAKRTPFYSGSDLKNVAVSAALACVKEENELAAQSAAVKEASSSITSSSKKEEKEPSDSSTTTPPSPSPSPSQATQPQQQPPPPPPSHLLPNKPYTIPPKRTLLPHHFDTALQEITASISEDMASLNAIKKFDEQFGDRRGANKRRKDFGFGVLSDARDERVVRVRV